jgi:hypothetical protein
MRTFGMNMAADLSRCKIALYRRWGEEEATVEATLQTELEQPDPEQEGSVFTNSTMLKT